MGERSQCWVVGDSLVETWRYCVSYSHKAIEVQNGLMHIQELKTVQSENEVPIARGQ